MSFEKVVESQIEDAIARGEFSGLPGEGLPLRLNPLEKLAGNDWLGFHVLEEGDMLPEWLELGRDIERDEEHLRAVRMDFLRLADFCHANGEWEPNVPRLRVFLDQYAQRGRSLRAKQDRFNMMAPGPATQRPGIWVDEKVRLLQQSMHDRGAPEHAVAAVWPSPEPAPTQEETQE